MRNFDVCFVGLNKHHVEYRAARQLTEEPQYHVCIVDYVSTSESVTIDELWNPLYILVSMISDWMPKTFT